MPYTLQEARRLQDEARQKAFTTKDPWERCEYIREMNQWEGYISAMIDHDYQPLTEIKSLEPKPIYGGIVGRTKPL